MTVGVGLPPTVAPACRVWPTVVTPLMVGWLSAGAVVIRVVGSDGFSSDVEPFVARAITWSLKPASAGFTRYVSAVAAPMSVQVNVLQRCHWYVTAPGVGAPDAEADAV